LLGYPIVGDFDGNGVDDLGVFNNDQFFFDLSFNPVADANATIDNNLPWGFPGVLDRPVAADMDQDGIDDIGLWVPRANAQNPEAAAEWFFLISNDFAGANPVGTLDALNHPFEPVPFGNDLYAEFGNELAAPLVGNFDPPITSEPPIGPDADFDGNGDTDGFDFLAWQRGYGMASPQHSDGDADDSDTVDGNDLDVWELQYGTTAPLVAAASAPISAESFSTEPVGGSSLASSDLVDVALTVALAEEADGVSGKREFVAYSPALEFFSAEPIRQSDSVPGSDISSSATNTTRADESQSLKGPSPWEDAVDEVFASVFK
jgi:hypothetical protein